MSEPNGFFRSDNFLSNERGYQVVIPDLVKTAKAGRVYLGVGPEQNFPYIIALKPELAFIFDIRRGNLHEQLLYKALFEMSSDRADFLSKLWSRARPAGARRLIDRRAADGSVSRRRARPDDLRGQLQGDFRLAHATRIGSALRDGDLDGIDYVYKTAFYDGGPDLRYSFGGGMGGMRSTYEEIQSLDDGTGTNRGFLGSEAALAGDEGSRDAQPARARSWAISAARRPIRSVGAYLKSHGAVVSAFYLSNVEEYLNQDGKENAFLCNVASLPLDDSSTFIYTGGGRDGAGAAYRGAIGPVRPGFGGGYGGRRSRFGGGGLNVTFLRPDAPDAKTCAATRGSAIAS